MAAASPFRPHRGVYAALAVIGAIASLAWDARRSLGWELTLLTLGVCGVLAFAIGIGFRIYCSRAQRELNARADEALASDLPLVLYLRPFMTGGNLFVRNALGNLADRILMGWHWDAEFALSLAVEGKARLVAVGGGEDSLGAAKLTVDDAGWKEAMQQCAERAHAIIAVPLSRPSTLWEMSYLASNPHLVAKTLFFMPPGDHGAMAREWWTEGQKHCVDYGLRLPDYRIEGGWVRVDASGAWTVLLPIFAMEPAQTWKVISTLFPLSGHAEFEQEARRVDAALLGMAEDRRVELIRAAEEEAKKDAPPPTAPLKEQFKDLLKMVVIVTVLGVGVVLLLLVIL